MLIIIRAFWATLCLIGLQDGSKNGQNLSGTCTSSGASHAEHTVPLWLDGPETDGCKEPMETAQMMVQNAGCASGEGLQSSLRIEITSLEAE